MGDIIPQNKKINFWLWPYCELTDWHQP